jgi:hypothetical protein
MSKIKSFYANGKNTSTGYLEYFNRDYDCKSQKNVYQFTIVYENYWEPDGKQSLVNGTGIFNEYDEHGLKSASGEYNEFQKTGYWNTWDKDSKLNSAGKYVNGKEDGNWWYGDLEGLNFIDNACFDVNSAVVMKEIARLKKQINIKHVIFKNGIELSKVNFDMNMNKEKKYYGSYGPLNGTPSF